MPTSTSGGTTTSFNNAPQAAADDFSSLQTGLIETSLGIVYLDVMANDLGGNAKRLWSVDNGVNNSGAMSGYVAGDLLAQDTARAESVSSDTSLNGARIWITADGKVGYDASTLSASFKAQLQSLSAGQELTDTFTYAIRLGSGTLSWSTATVHIAGGESANHAPVITSASSDATGTLSETAGVTGSAALLGTSGTVSYADADALDTHTIVKSGPQFVYSAGSLDAGQIAALTAASSLSLVHTDAAGSGTGSVAWSFAVVDGSLDFLAAGETLTVTYLVTVTDSHGAATQQTLTVLVQGTNDQAVIGAPAVTDVTEDIGVDAAGMLTATGVIAVTDADHGQAGLQAVVSGAPENLGTLTLGSNGAYTYAVSNASVQYLGAGDSKVESFTITSLDGTTRAVSFTIHGADDAPVIGAPTVADVTDGTAGADGNITVSGSISISDADGGEGSFVGGTFGAGAGGGGSGSGGGGSGGGGGAGDGGFFGTLTLGSDGTYTYTVSGSAIAFLGAGETATDVFTVYTTGGASETITFTLHGTNDAALIGAPTVADVTEDVAVDAAGYLIASGAISISDIDQNQASFRTTVTGAGDNLGNLSLAADGSYTYAVSNAAVQYLGAGDSQVDTFSITSLDGTSRLVAFTIHGTEDAPIIVAAQGDSAGQDLTETNSGLTASGTLTAIDQDLTDVVTATVIGVTHTGPTGGLSDDQLLSYFWVSQGAIVDSSHTSGQLTWTFNSAGQAFDHLAVGETLTLHYTVRPDDGHNPTPVGDGVVTMTIVGTNDVPVITSQARTAGVLDATFGTAGVTRTPMGSSRDDASSVAIQSDGKIVVAGSIFNPITADPATGWEFGVARYNPDGTLDQSFGNGGKVLTSVGQFQYEFASAVAIEPDGRILVAGNDTYHATVVAYHPDGSFDTGFGSGGIAILDQWTDAQSKITSIALQPNGQILAAGAVAISGGTEIGIWRLNADGTRDQSFGGAGRIYAQLGESTSEASAIAVQADGKILVSGSSDHNGFKNFTLARFNADGSLDASFGNAGVVTTAAGDDISQAFDMAVQADGRIVLVGYSHNVAQSLDPGLGFNSGIQLDSTLVRYNTDGSLDTSFGAGGTVIYSTSTPNPDTATSVAIQPDGKIVIAGHGSGGFAARFNVDGTVDTSFGNGGLSYAAPSTGTDMALQANGDIVLVGTDYSVGDGDFSVALLSGGSASPQVAEDRVQSASGRFAVSDVDDGAILTLSIDGGGTGSFGTLTVQNDGAWAYTLNNAAQNVQALAQGESREDVFIVRVTDEHGASSTTALRIGVHGTNDGAVIGTPTVDDVTEDAAVDGSGNLTASGTISISDADQGQSSFRTTVMGANGNLGSLSLAADGSYTYAVSNAAVQYLGAGDTKVDTFTVTALDGTTRQVSFTIHGTNDAPTVTGAVAGSVTEDNPRFLQTRGNLLASDADGNPPSWSIVGGTTTPQTQDFRFQADNLKIVKNGTTFFEDTFGDGNPPPSAPSFTNGPATSYTTQGSFTEAAGRLLLDGTKAVVFGTAAYGERALLNTDTSPVSDPVNGAKGLKYNTDFTAEARFDLVIPQDGGDQYGVRLSDQSSAAPNNTSTTDLVVLRDASGVHVALRAIDLSTSTVTVLETKDIAVGSGDQIVLRLDYNHNNYAGSATGGLVTASFDLMSAGVVTSTTSFAARGTIFKGEDFTQVQLVGQTNQNETGVYQKTGTYGTLTVAQDGEWHYFLADQQANVQALTQGQQVIDTFTVQVSDGHGGVTTQAVAVTVNGVNDAAIIGNPTVADVTEDLNVNGAGNLTATGTVSITDVDSLAAFQTSVTPFPNALGTLTLAANGSYSYVVANSAVQYLGANDTKIDSFTIKAVDGTQKVVNFTIHGANDSALIGNPTATDVTEDLNVNGAGILTATGTVPISDIDNAAAFQTAVTPFPNALGSLTLAANGSYSYAVANSAVQYLGVNDTKVDSFTIKAVDGTQSVVNFTIHGANDAPIANPDSDSAIIEQGTLVFGTAWANGQVLMNDIEVDNSDILSVAGVVAGTTTGPLTGNLNSSVAGTYGTLSMQSNGGWVYHLDDSNPLTDALAQGQLAQDVFTYTASDGHGGTSNATLTINITGTDDGPTASLPRRAMLEGSGVHQIDLLAGANDPEGDAVHFGGISEPWSFVTLNPDGHTISIDTNSDWFNNMSMGQTVDYNFTYDLIDSHGVSRTQWATFRMVGTDDRPTTGWDGQHMAIASGATDPGYPDPQMRFFTSDIDWDGLNPDNSPVQQPVFADTTGWSATGHGTFSKQGVYGWLEWNLVAGFNPGSQSEYGTLTYHLDNSDPDTLALNSSDNVYDNFDVTVTDGTLSTTRTVHFEVVGRDDMYGHTLHWEVMYPTITTPAPPAANETFVVGDQVELTGYADADTNLTRDQILIHFHDDFYAPLGGNYMGSDGLAHSAPPGPDDTWTVTAVYSGTPFNGWMLEGLPQIQSISLESGSYNNPPMHWDSNTGTMWVDNQGLFYPAGADQVWNLTFKAGTPLYDYGINPQDPFVDVGATSESIGPTITVHDGFTFDLNVAYDGIVQFEGTAGTLKFETTTFTGTVTNFSDGDILDFSAITNGDASVHELTDGTLAAHSIGWATNGSDTVVYVNASDNSQTTQGADMSVHLQNVTLLHNGNFIV